MFLRAVGGILKTPFKGGLASRTLLGAGVGGTVGAFRGDVTGEGRMQEIFKHAALGALGGATWHGAARFGPGMLKAGWKPALRAGWAGTKGVGRAARFAWRHPLATVGGVAAVGGGLYAANNLGPQGGTPSMSPTLAGQVAMSYNQRAIAAQEMMGGVSPMGFVGSAPEFYQYQQQRAYRERLYDSTTGLVQGLHRGRH
jgi:hypothetical protein